VPLWLDHASVAVPGLPAAVAELDTQLGLRATVSLADPYCHSRVYLDRGYLEVSACRSARCWTIQGFFLRFRDAVELRHHLDAAGLACRFGVYTGVDGRWDDVEVVAGAVPVPILVRRTHPPDIARDWPPQLGVAHRCGARTLDTVRVVVPDLGAAVDVYARLTGAKPAFAKCGSGSPHVAFRLASGRIELTEGAKPGVDAIVLGVARLTEPASVAGPLSGSPIAWLDPAAAHGLRIGFVEVDGLAHAS
jgi:hypothetical protein